MRDATRNSDICELYTEGSHHRNLSVICLLQNIYHHGRENRTMSLNTQYLVLFENPRDQLQVMTLSRQMFPHRSYQFMDQFNRATTKPYGYLVIDLKQNTPDYQRIRTDVFINNNESMSTPHSYLTLVGITSCQMTRVIVIIVASSLHQICTSINIRSRVVEKG